jgi:WD domain, G-beta repeat
VYTTAECIITARENVDLSSIVQQEQGKRSWELLPYTLTFISFQVNNIHIYINIISPLSPFPLSLSTCSMASTTTQLVTVPNLTKHFSSVHHAFGFAVEHDATVEYLEPNVILTVGGNCALILDFRETGLQYTTASQTATNETAADNETTSAQCHDDSKTSGIAALPQPHVTVLQTPGSVATRAVAVHPSGKYFAVAGAGNKPDIIIYSYPELKLQKTLRRGTEREYSDVVFNPAGNLLASVGAAPDFLLTVWDWDKELIMLHAKAFSQEVFRVSFSPYLDGRLITSGTGHIRFWKMAKTFTGLKLQGHIGKFGSIDLTDIRSFAELPNGKVVSGSETGHLLIWDDNLIEYQIVRPDGSAVHQGPLECVMIHDQWLLSAGDDGYIRRWDLDKMQFAENEDASVRLVMEPVDQVFLGENVRTKNMVLSEGYFLIYNADGTLIRMEVDDFSKHGVVHAFHAGAITGAHFVPESYNMITCGADGSVRCWDAAQKQLLAVRHFPAAATCLEWVTKTLFLVGFSDGVTRLLRRTKAGIQLIQSFKPHSVAVKQICFAPDKTTLATCAQDNTVFFFHLNVGESQKPSFEPIGFVPLPAIGMRGVESSSTAAQVWRSAAWSPDSGKFAVSISDVVVEYTRPEFDAAALVAHAHRETFEIDVPYVLIQLKAPYKPFSLDHNRSSAEDDKVEATASTESTKTASQSDDTKDSAPAETNDGAGDDEDDNNEEFVDPLGEQCDDIANVLYSADGKELLVSFEASSACKHDTFVKPAYGVVFCYDTDTLRTTAAVDAVEQLRPSTPLHADKCDGPCTNATEDWLVAPAHEFAWTHELNASGDVVRHLSYSHDTTYMLLASRSGTVQIRPASTTAIGQARPCFSWNMHSSTVSTSQVRGVALADNHRMLVTTADDGQMFVFVLDPQSGFAAKWDASQAKALSTLPMRVSPAALPASENVQQVPTGAVPTSMSSKPADATEQSAESKHTEAPSAAKATEAEEADVENPAAATAASDSTSTSTSTSTDTDTNTDTDAAATKALCIDANAPVIELPSSPVRSPRHEEIKKNIVEPPVDETVLPANEDAGDDIVGAAYSIEEAKLQKEEDERRAAAELHKQNVLKEVEKLREEFMGIVKQNSALPPAEKLDDEAFYIDPDLTERFKVATQEKIQRVRAEMAAETELHDQTLKSLRAHYLDDILVEHFTLHSFGSDATVQSYRVKQLPRELQEEIAKVHTLIEAQDRNAQGKLGSGISADDSKSLSAAKTNSDGKHANRRGGDVVASGRAHMTEAQRRRHEREQRRARREELEAAEPDPDADDPKDVAAIEDAITNMGDYKLKSDPQYVVPPSQRVNAEKKRHQIVLLQESVHYMKMRFNERVLALRNSKKRLCDSIIMDNERLREINVALGNAPDADLLDPYMLADDPAAQHAKEWPENRERYTDSDLDNFVAEQARIAEEQKRAQRAANNMYAEDDNEDEQDTISGAQAQAKTSSDTATSDGNTASSALESNNTAASVGDVKTGTTGSGFAQPSIDDIEPVDQATQEERHALLMHERSSVLRKMGTALREFDCSLLALRHEKFRLDADLKSAELKLLVMFYEQKVLSSFQSQEVKLIERFETATVQKTAIVTNMQECEASLAIKLEEIEAWQAKDRAVLEAFSESVGGPKSEHYNALWEIFRKKVKRRRRHRASDEFGDPGDADALSDVGSDISHASDDSMDDDESEMSDGSDGSSDAGSDAAVKDDDSCPPGCDIVVYEKVLELRERRIRQEDMLNDFNRAVSDLNKKYQQYKLQEKNIDKELQACDREIEKFERSKQQALNQIEVTIPVKLSQIRSLDPQTGGLRNDVSDALVFTASGLQGLQERITEVQQEKQSLRQRFKDLKRDHRQLTKELDSKQQAINVEKQKCREVQMLKFGQIIDLSILERVGDDKVADGLRSQLHKLENSSIRKTSQFRSEMRAAREELHVVSELNTSLLNKVAQLTKTQHDLDAALDSTTRSVVVADKEPLARKEKQERERLQQTCMQQREEIDALKAEIYVLRHKGGRIFTGQS